jgi:DNA-binding response OmpR family regulator
MRVLSSQQARVLIVDDIPENRILLCRYFGIRGFMMVQAESGAAALTMIQRQSFDAVLLDIMMPGMDGIEVLKRIRALHSPLNLPVIMVSGKSARMDISLAMDLGANDYLTKPIDLAAAVIRVRGHLAPKHAAHH